MRFVHDDSIKNKIVFYETKSQSAATKHRFSDPPKVQLHILAQHLRPRGIIRIEMPTYSLSTLHLPLPFISL